MKDNRTSRRALLGAMAAAPAVAALAVPAFAASSGDAAILAAWEARQAALARIEQRGTFFDAEAHSPADVDIYDAADCAITKATATTPRGLLAQAWVALSYTQDSFTPSRRRENALIRRADYEALAQDRAIDWEVQSLLAVIRSLRAMIGEA